MDGYRRYDYLHCKYLIVDGRRTVITSDNWAKGLEENRGWGIAVDSLEFASYVNGLFLQDFRNTSFDINDISYLSIQRKDFIFNGSIPPMDEILTCRAQVMPVISSDHAFADLSDLISMAEERIFVETLAKLMRTLLQPLFDTGDAS